MWLPLLLESREYRDGFKIMKWMKHQNWQCDISYPQEVFVVFDFPENPTPESHRSSRGGLGPGRSGSTQLLVVAVCACAIHAQLQTANVEINVYFPGGFLRSDSRVFLSSENNNEVTVISNDTQLNINVFGKYVYVIWRPQKMLKGTKIGLMYQSNRSLNIPPGNPRAFEFLENFCSNYPSRGRKAVQMPHHRSIPGDQMPPAPGKKLCM